MESHPRVIVVGSKDDENADIRDGTLLLAPAGPARRLLYEGDDVGRALDALKRFLAALPKERVERPGPGHACVDLRKPASFLVHLFWRTEGEGEESVLRIVAIPDDPYDTDDSATDITEAIARWTIVHGVFPSFRHDIDATTCVHTPNAPYKLSIVDAVADEFRAKGLNLEQEEVAMSVGCLLARGPKEEVLWSVLWAEDQQDGTWAVRHHADPFDASGEHEVLLAIFRRATGLEPKMVPHELR